MTAAATNPGRDVNRSLELPIRLDRVFANRDVSERQLE